MKRMLMTAALTALMFAIFPSMNASAKAPKWLERAVTVPHGVKQKAKKIETPAVDAQIDVFSTTGDSAFGYVENGKVTVIGGRDASGRTVTLTGSPEGVGYDLSISSELAAKIHEVVTKGLNGIHIKHVVTEPANQIPVPDPRKDP